MKNELCENFVVNIVDELLNLKMDMLCYLLENLINNKEHNLYYNY